MEGEGRGGDVSDGVIVLSSVLKDLYSKHGWGHGTGVYPVEVLTTDGSVLHLSQQ